MEYIKKEELIIGEIYKSTLYNHIFKYLDKNGDKNPNISKTYNMFNKDLATIGHGLNKVINTTSEEKHWLNCCITADKFITFEEAMKTFITEYVETVSNKHSSSEIIGTIYKTSELPKWVQGHKLEEYWKAYMFHYKPSTKEAYDAQFVVKEEEFVLPEKWCVLRDFENHQIINKWFNDNGYGTPSANTTIIAISENKNNYISPYSGNLPNHIKITFEQFKKYVLKEEIIEEKVIEEKVIEPLPQFKVIETIETITKVENNEGNQFFIGDVVISSNGTIQTIESFDYNKAKTNIIAFTNKQSILGNGIGIDKIEHYIESKVEETLLEKAKIIEHSHDFKIGDKIKIRLGNREFNFVYKIIKIEDNVLFFGNSIHSRVLAKNVIKVN